MKSERAKVGAPRNFDVVVSSPQSLVECRHARLLLTEARC